MFNVGWAELLVLIVIGLFVFGPERLPGAVASFARGVRQVREYAQGAKEQLQAEMGPEFDELRAPLQELGKMRGMTPRSVVTKHLFDGLDPVEDQPKSGPSLTKPNNFAPPTGNGSRVEKPLQAGERAPFDPDAT